jgi:hypothetical protein
MRGLGLDERDVDGANGFAGGKVENPVFRAIIAIPNEHAAKRFGESLSTKISSMRR